MVCAVKEVSSEPSMMMIRVPPLQSALLPDPLSSRPDSTLSGPNSWCHNLSPVCPSASSTSFYTSVSPINIATNAICNEPKYFTSPTFFSEVHDIVCCAVTLLVNVLFCAVSWKYDDFAPFWGAFSKTIASAIQLEHSYHALDLSAALPRQGYVPKIIYFLMF